MIDFVTEDGTVVSIETAPTRREGAANVSRKGQNGTGDKRLDAVLLRIRKVAEAVSDQLRELSASSLAPAETEVEFGVSVSAEADAVIVRGSGEATFNVRMTWTNNGTAENAG
ncbi:MULTISPECIES: CU044_2847 family protein [unclassified Nocardiopsis]|uniref:CU044_2847 family protein n=1 Tax=unclassified Nocardiopsis TaxID=2649073 RepID=UPI00135943A9|nr:MULTISPECIES: CU044_2847 family protein [unclassified Nocardiopsis]